MYVDSYIFGFVGPLKPLTQKKLQLLKTLGLIVILGTVLPESTRSAFAIWPMPGAPVRLGAKTYSSFLLPLTFQGS